MMTHAWLEADGCRLPMKRLGGGMSVQFATHGVDYRVGIFIMGQAPPAECRVAGITLASDGSCGLLWGSGATTRLGIVANALVAGCRRCGEVLLTWRDDDDRMIQRESFPVGIAE